VRMPAVEEEDGQREADEEDTLSGLEGIPVIEAEEPPQAHAPARRRRFSRGATAIGIVAIAAALLGLGVWELARAHFVGADADGHVAVYQGLPWSLGGGIHLYRIVYKSPLLAVQLSQAERRRLFDHDLRSEASAVREVKSYERYVVP
jgi:hypothetical protein